MNSPLSTALAAKNKLLFSFKHFLLSFTIYFLTSELLRSLLINLCVLVFICVFISKCMFSFEMFFVFNFLN